MQKGKTFFECLFENLAFSFSNEVISVDVANRHGDNLDVRIKVISGTTIEFSLNATDSLQSVTDKIKNSLNNYKDVK